jgi:antitoxin (DNA-binding transcriptional repressor) of toxin-antitoxin stability system
MLVISSREFRENQKSYLDKVDEGVEILIQRGKNKSYKIVPSTENDTIINKKYILAPDEDLHRAITMDELLKGVKEDIREMFRNGKK